MDNNSQRVDVLRGTRERRQTVTSDCELREASNGLLHYEGIFTRFDDPYEVTDRFGTFTETVDRRALTRTLSLKPDVVFLVNHDGLPLARTTSATMRISATENAGIVSADFEPRDPDVQAVRYKVERGDMPDMSWAFRAISDEWNADETERRLLETSMDGGDVSIVTTGANRNTSGSFRSALDTFANFDRALTEAREADSLNVDDLRAAYENLGRLIHEIAPKKTLSIKAAELELMLSS